MAESQWREIFESFDADGSGQVNARELVDMIKRLGKDDEDAKAIAYVSILPAMLTTHRQTCKFVQIRKK